MDSFTGTVRFLIGAMMLGALTIGFLMTAGISYVAPKVAEDYGERAERLGQEAIVAAREEARARDLAEDGWGYSQPNAGEGRTRDENGEDVGGWGAD